VQRFRGGLVFKADRLFVSLNSRLESNKEEEKVTRSRPRRIKTETELNSPLHQRCHGSLFATRLSGNRKRISRYQNLPSGRESSIGVSGATILSDTMYLLISFRKSTPPQNRQLNIFISNSKQ